jgi:hypothetical protein
VVDDAAPLELGGDLGELHPLLHGDRDDRAGAAVRVLG